MRSCRRVTRPLSFAEYTRGLFEDGKLALWLNDFRMASTLELILLLLAASVIAVTAFRWVHLPPLLGYLVVGGAIGPHALSLIADSEGMRRLAEFGIVFLMFSIGLEFNLATLFSMRRAVFGLGLAQV